ncbi:MAG: hypothetical protein H6923_03460 [Alphaproteobacteria bacterium]|nr:hypothetical protein [Alphaproteobacteria bacterium]
MRAWIALAASAACVLALGACGDDEPSAELQQKMTETAKVQLAQAQPAPQAAPGMAQGQPGMPAPAPYPAAGGTQPGMAQPPAQQAMTQPGMAQPGMAQPGMAQPGQPGSFMPGEHAPAAGMPGMGGMQANAASGVVINGVDIPPQTLAQLGQIPPGRYWYDQISGLWGIEGYPVQGQIQPGLPLGGPLQPTASGAGVTAQNTGVFFNGRELHPMEVQGLIQIFGQAPPGRYWLNAQLVGGPEGGGPMFNLAQAMQGAQGQGGTTYVPGMAGTTGTSVGVDENGCGMVSMPDGSFHSGC